MHRCRYVPPWLYRILACMGFRMNFGLFSSKKLMEENELRNWVMGDPKSLASKESKELVALLKSRGCFGCFTKPPIIISMDDASKGLRTQGEAEKKDNRTDDFWSSSISEMDHCAAVSQRSISSIGISNHPSDPQSSAGIQTDPPEFVNHGLLLWNQTRQQWVGHRRPESQTQVRGPRISWNATYDTLVGTNKPFPRPIPLREMVEFLVDIWELEGML